MIKELVGVKITDEFKEELINVIDDTINKVIAKSGTSVSNRKLNKVRNLSLDQINVDVSTRANLKTLWVINIENDIPIIVEKDKGFPNISEINSNGSKGGAYKMKPNLTWTYSKDNLDDGLNSKQFQDKVLSMLLEDAETAAFYGAMSCVDDRNG